MEVMTIAAVSKAFLSIGVPNSSTQTFLEGGLVSERFTL
jgi:hypothetical protein